MNDSEFLMHVYRYAEVLKGDALTDDERNIVVGEFNDLKGDAHSRALQAVRKALGIEHQLEELRKSANLDNTQRLLIDLQNAAAKWQASKK